MGRLKDLLVNGRRTPDLEAFKDNQKLIAQQGEATKPDQSELDRIQQFPFKFETIHDLTTEAILEDKVATTVFKPKINENGTIEYETIQDPKFPNDPKKKILLRDGNNNPIPVYEQHIKINDHYASLLNALSHKNRLTFLRENNAVLYWLLVEDLVETVKMSIPEDDFDLGTGNYLNSLQLEAFMLGNDAVNGNKVKALLEQRRTSRFEFDDQNKKKKGFF